MAALAPLLNADLIKKLLLPVMVTLGQDPVPNIRMNVAKTLYIMQPHIKGSGDLEVSIPIFTLIMLL
jgi:hypothetical protein